MSEQEKSLSEELRSRIRNSPEGLVGDYLTVEELMEYANRAAEMQSQLARLRAIRVDCISGIYER